MKKRKKPIVLGAVLLLLLAFVVAFNFSNFTASQPQDQQPDPKAVAAADPAPDEHPKNPILAKEKAERDKAPAKGVMQKAEEEEVLPIHGKGHDAIRPSDPKIMAPPEYKPKPVAPKDGSVNSQGQWYSKESGAG